MVGTLSSAAGETQIEKSQRDSHCGAEGKRSNFLCIEVSVLYWVRWGVVQHLL